MKKILVLLFMMTSANIFATKLAIPISISFNVDGVPQIQHFKFSYTLRCGRGWFGYINDLSDPRSRNIELACSQLPGNAEYTFTGGPYMLISKGNNEWWIPELENKPSKPLCSLENLTPGKKYKVSFSSEPAYQRGYPTIQIATYLFCQTIEIQ